MPALSNTVTHFAGGETRRTRTVRLGTTASRFISFVSSGLNQGLHGGLVGVTFTFLWTDLVHVEVFCLFVFFFLKQRSFG